MQQKPNPRLSIPPAGGICDLSTNCACTFFPVLLKTCELSARTPLQPARPACRWLEKANARRGAEDTLEKTLFVRLATLGVTPLLLRRQYRCHPRLSGLASRLFYQGRCATRYGHTHPHPRACSWFRLREDMCIVPLKVVCGWVGGWVGVP